MNSSLRTLPLRALVGLAAGAALLSSAPFAAADPLAGAPAPGAMAEHWRQHRQEREEAHARALHDVLNIRADQEPAFHAFLDAMKPPEMGDHERGKGGPGGPGAPDEMAHLTTPQRLDRMSARMAERQARMQSHIQAVKTFYAALSPEQQRAFDSLGELRHFGGGHGGPGRGGPGPQAMNDAEESPGPDFGPGPAPGGPEGL